MNADENSVATILASYHDALNNSDTEVVIKLYAPDGVFMPQHFPSSVGADAVRKAYNAVFDAITLNAKLVVAEVHQMASGLALTLTNSAGTVKVHATGESRAEANQELFVLKKIDDEWKIACYCFSTTNPLRC